MKELLKVSAKSNPNGIAGAIASLLRKGYEVELQAIGAAAINQAVKGIAIARTFTAAYGKDFMVLPSFVDVVINNNRKTAMRFILEDFKSS